MNMYDNYKKDFGWSWTIPQQIETINEYILIILEYLKTYDLETLENQITDKLDQNHDTKEQVYGTDASGNQKMYQVSSSAGLPQQTNTDIPRKYNGMLRANSPTVYSTSEDKSFLVNLNYLDNILYDLKPNGNVNLGTVDKPFKNIYVESVHSDTTTQIKNDIASNTEDIIILNNRVNHIETPKLIATYKLVNQNDEVNITPALQKGKLYLFYGYNENLPISDNRMIIFVNDNDLFELSSVSENAILCEFNNTRIRAGMNNVEIKIYEIATQ